MVRINLLSALEVAIYNSFLPVLSELSNSNKLQGWKNVLDCILRLFYARLLPSAITEVEDFVDGKGWVSIQRLPPP